MSGCKDCNGRTHWYIVHNDVWRDAGMAPFDGELCMQCLESRLGRPLTRDDFKPFANGHGSCCPRLAQILGVKIDKAGRRKPMYQQPDDFVQWLLDGQVDFMRDDPAWAEFRDDPNWIAAARTYWRKRL